MKKLLSMALALMMILSTIVVAGTASAAETATINGKTFEVGSEITYELSLQVPEKIENFQGAITYDAAGLTYKKYTKNSTLTNGSWSVNGTTTAGKVFYSASDGEEGYDVTTKKVIATFIFTVAKAGSYSISNAFDVVTGYDPTKPSGTPYIKDGKVVNTCSTGAEVKGTEVTPTNPTNPTNPSDSTKAIVNGKQYNVGDEVQFEIILQVPEKIENFQGAVTYDAAGLTYKKYTKNSSLNNGSWSVNGTTTPGKVFYSASDGEEGYDVTTKKAVATFTFTVAKAGTYSITNAFDVVTGYDPTKPAGTPYIKDGKIVNTCTTDTNTLGGTTPSTTSTTSVTSKTTVNGQPCQVGDILTFTVSSAFAKPIAAIQGNILYSNEGLEVQGAKVTWGSKINNGSKISNTHNKTIIAGSEVISYSALRSLDEEDEESKPYDLSSSSEIVKVQFKVVKEGTWKIENKYVAVTADDGTKYVLSGNKKEAFTESSTVTGGTAPTTSSTKPTTSSTKPTTSSTKPAPTKTTFNGTEVQVGDVIEVAYYLKSSKNIYAFDGVYTWGNSTTGDKTGIQIVSGSQWCIAGDGTIGASNLRFTQFGCNLNCTTEKKFATVKFKVTQVGTYFATAAMNELIDLSYDDITGFTWRMVQTNTSTTTATKPTTSSTKPTTSSTKPTTSSTKPTTSSTSTTPTTVPTYTITKSLGQSTCNNAATTIKKGETFAAKFTPNNGYKIDSVTVKNGSASVTATKNSDGTYSVSFAAAGNITVTVATSLIPTTAPSYDIVMNLTKVKSSSTATTIKKGAAYQTVLTPEAGYEIVTVLASNGEDVVTPTKNSDGSYSISVTAKGDIYVTAIANPKATTGTTSTKPTDPVAKTFNVTKVLTNATINNTATTIKEGETYSAVISPAAGCTIPAANITVLVNNQAVTPIKTGDLYTINVKATGDIMIVVQGVKSETTTSTSTTKPTEGTTVETEPVTKPGDVINITKMTLDHATLTLREGETINLVAALWPGYTTEKTITWSVTNSRVGVCSQSKNTVVGLTDEAGKLYCTEMATFTAKDDGQTVVKAVSNTGLVVKCVINVKPVAETLSVNKSSVTVNAGKTTSIKATVGPTSLASTYRQVTYSTSNKKVATVTSAGVIKGVSKGTATITVTSKDNTSLKKTVKVTVKQPVTKISFSKSSISLAKKGATATVKVTASPSNANNKNMTIKSTKTSVVTVNKSSISSGATVKVTAKKKGTAYIQATAKDGSKKTAKIKVTVKK